MHPYDRNYSSNNPFAKGNPGNVGSYPYQDLDSQRFNTSGVGINEAASFYSEKIDQNRSGYLHPMLSANRAQMMSIFAAVAAIFVLVSFILCWIMAVRSDSNLFVWFTIALGLILLTALMVAALGFMMKGILVADKPENKLYSALSYFGAVLSGAFLLMTVLVLLFHRYVHFNTLLSVFDNSDTFKARYPASSSFQDAWTSDKRMIWWIAFFNFLAAICFGVCAFLMWSISKFMIQLARGLLALAGGLAVLFFVLAMYQAEKALKSNLQHPAGNNFYSYQDWSAVWWLLLVACILIILNLVFNIVKKRIVYFFLGFILLILLIVLAIKVTYNMRSFRQGIEPGQKNTDDALAKLALLDENDIKSACGKYNALGVSCGKKYDTVWIEGNSDKRSLNPACARNAMIYMHQPMYWCGYFTLIGLAFLVVVIACDFYLSDVTEFLETFNKETSIFEYIGLGIALLVFLIGLIWLLSASFNKYRVLHKNDPQVYDRLQAGTYVDPDYQIVPRSILTLDRKATEVCGPYDATKMVSVQANPTCTKTVCGYRIGILSEAMQLGGVPDSAIGNSDLRGIIFPNARNALDRFLVFNGTAGQVNDILKNIRFCPQRYNKDLSVYYNIEEVDLTQMNTDATKKTEASPLPSFSTTTGGTRGFPTTSTYGSNMVCKSSTGCQYENRIPMGTGLVTITGNVYGKNTQGVYTLANTEMASNLRVDAVHGNDVYVAIDEGNILNGGLIVVQVPASTNTPYVLDLKVTDVTGKYKPYMKQVTIPSIDGEIKSLGRIPLILPSGGGCIGEPDFVGCTNKNQQQGTGTFVLTVINSDTNQPVGGAEYSIVKGHGLAIVNPVSTGTTDSSGKAVINNMNYDYYTVHSLAPNFVEGVAEFVLESPNYQKSLFLSTNSLTAMDATLLIENADIADTDLKMRIRNEQGKECVVSSENKYCAYAYYLFDVEGGKSGMETIRVHNMTYSTYMVYSETNGNYGSCQSIDNANTHFQALAKGIDWSNTVAAAPASHNQGSPSTEADKNYKYWVAYCFTGFGQQSIKSVNSKFPTDPGASICTALYPDSDKYSLRSLKAKVQSLGLS